MSSEQAQASSREIPADPQQRAELIQQLGTELESTLSVSSSYSDAAFNAENNLDFLAALILTDIYEYGYPDIFHGMWQLLTTVAHQPRGKHRYALGIPRGFSKTVVLKLYCVWLILFSNRNFILVVCNTATLAENFLADVVDMLSSINIVTIFGAWNAACEKDTQSFKKFSFRGRDIVLAALGAGSSLRGLNLKFRRPDVVIMDDMQNRDQAQNPEVAKELLIWMLGTLMKACHPQRCVFVFVGNMYPFEGSILRKLKADPSWISFITAAILADGESLWPEHRSVEDLMEELALDTSMGHPEIFYSEVMNDEAMGNISGIDITKIPHAPEDLQLFDAQGGFIIIDPSLGKKKGDDLGIGAVLIFDGIPFLMEVVSEKMDPGETIKRATLLAVKYSMQLIVVEGGAYQASLIFWFDYVYKQLGIAGIHVGEITTGGMQKNARIRDGLKMLIPQAPNPRPRIYLHKNCRNAVVYQISQWNPLKTNNKDELLDILAYIYKVMELHVEHLPLLITAHETSTIPDASHTADLALAF